MENLYVTSEITLNKTAGKRSSPVPTDTEFFSYDQRVAKKIINFQFKGEPLDLSEANVILGFDFVAAGQSVIFESADGSIKIEDPTAGKVNVMLPNDIYAYSGDVIIYVFVEFSNGQSLDYPAFSTEFKESWLDQDLEEMAQFYVKRFEDLRKLVLEQVSGIDSDLAGFEERIAEIETKLDAFDIDALAQEIEETLRSELEYRLSDIEKRIDEGEVVTARDLNTRLENLLFGEEFTHDAKMDFTGKIRGSFEENLNRSGGTVTSSLPSHAAGGTEITQGQYNTLSKDDDTVAAISNTTANGRMYVTQTWDILGDFKQKFPAIFNFFQPQTLEEEVSILLQFIEKIQFTAYACIHQTLPYPIIGYRRPPENAPAFNWEEMASHEATTPEILTFPLEIITQRGSDTTTTNVGKAASVLRGPSRQETGQSTIRIRYTFVEYTVSFSMLDLFVRRQVENLASPSMAMINELAQRVNELEKKGR